MQDLYMATVEKAEYIQQEEYQLVSVWECEIHRELSCNEEMNRYFNEFEGVEPLEPHHAFFGGRTNTMKLHHECCEGQKIR